jgi:hypothetical protein
MDFGKAAEPVHANAKKNAKLNPCAKGKTMEAKSVASAIQVAYYWKFKKPLDYLEASKVANDVVSHASFPKYLTEWLDYQVEKRNEAHPVVRFLVALQCDRLRGR